MAVLVVVGMIANDRALLVQKVGRGSDLDARILGGAAHHHVQASHSPLRLVTLLSPHRLPMVIDDGGREETPTTRALASLVVPRRLIDAYLAQGDDLAQELDLLHAVLASAGVIMVHCGPARGARTPTDAITVTALL